MNSSPWLRTEVLAAVPEGHRFTVPWSVTLVPLGAHCTTEPQRTGGPSTEQLDRLQSNRLDPSVSPRDERPGPLREGGGLDLCSARKKTTRGSTWVRVCTKTNFSTFERDDS